MPRLLPRPPCSVLLGVGEWASGSAAGEQPASCLQGAIHPPRHRVCHWHHGSASAPVAWLCQWRHVAASRLGLQFRPIATHSTSDPLPLLSPLGPQARQLHRDVTPALDAAHVKLYLITIGTPDKGAEFAAGTGFPADRLLADPANACYEALSFRRQAPLTTHFTPGSCACALCCSLLAALLPSCLVLGGDLGLGPCHEAGV